VYSRRDIMRWFGRVAPLQLKDKQLWCVFCFEPELLLPYQLADEFGRKEKSMRHPPRYQGMACKTIQKALHVAEQGWHIQPVDYLCDPSPQLFHKWIDRFYEQPSLLSWDIETPYKMSEDDEEDFEEKKLQLPTTILRTSYSYQACRAVSAPWLPEYMDCHKRMLAYEGEHCGWNIIGFDVPTVEKNNVHIGATIVLDGMDAWHLLETDLDKGLEHVTAFTSDLLPWKHLSDTDPALYSCIDADAALRNVQWTLDKLEKRVF
jgi:hypothetical protein